MFPGQPSGTVTSVCPGASPGSPSAGTRPEHLPREESRGLLIQIPEPPQLAPLNVEQRLNSDGWMDFFFCYSSGGLTIILAKT